MKKTLYWLCVALILSGVTAGCGNKKAAKNAETPEPAEIETYFQAIDKYLVEQIGSQYLPGEICIPYHDYIAVDESNAEDIHVWGDWWIDNLNVAGDTLKFVSGGSHPGLMHVRQTPEGHFEVTSFEVVEDGSLSLPSARRIFGDKYEAWQAANSDSDKRERVRGEAIALYARRNKLPVKFYQDYGWPAVTLPAID